MSEGENSYQDVSARLRREELPIDFWAEWIILHHDQFQLLQTQMKKILE